MKKTLLAQGHTDPKSQWIILQYTRKLAILQGFLEKFSERISVSSFAEDFKSVHFDLFRQMQRILSPRN